MILARHAESEWNRVFGQTRIDPGIEDPPLTERGHRQADALAQELATAGIARLIASPYRRTLETAAIVARAAAVPITIEPLVRERCVFSCDIGTPRSRLQEHWPDLDFSGLDEFWWGEQGETVAALGRRATTFRTRVAGLGDRSAVAVITHWGFIRALTGEAVDNATCVRLT